MRKIAALAVLLTAAVATPALAAEAPICLDTAQIDRTTVLNPKTILFHMKGGKVYRSAMRTGCLGLKYYGFEYDLHAPEICGGSQAIRVLNTNEICILGKFTPEIVGAHG